MRRGCEASSNGEQVSSSSINNSSCPICRVLSTGVRGSVIALLLTADPYIYIHLHTRIYTVGHENCASFIFGPMATKVVVAVVVNRFPIALSAAVGSAAVAADHNITTPGK